MTPKEARNAMQAKFLADWGSTTPIALDNQPFDPPDDDSSWVRFTVIFNGGEQAALGGEDGNRLFRRFGLIVIQVFTRIGVATNTNDDLSYQALKIFEGVEVAGIWFRNGRVTSIPAAREKWYQQNVVLEFEFDDIH